MKIIFWILGLLCLCAAPVLAFNGLDPATPVDGFMSILTVGLALFLAFSLWSVAEKL